MEYLFIFTAVALAVACYFAYDYRQMLIICKQSYEELRVKEGQTFREKSQYRGLLATHISVVSDYTPPARKGNKPPSFDDMYQFYLLMKDEVSTLEATLGKE